MAQEQANIQMGLDWTSSEVTVFIHGTFSRDVVLDCLLGFAGEFLSARMILVVGKAAVQPHMTADWPDLPNDATLRTTRVPVDPSAPVMSGELVDGTLSEIGLEGLAKALGAESNATFSAIPLPISGRTAVVLLGRHRDQRDLAGLEVIALECAAQLETLIKMTKSGSLPEKDQRVPEIPATVLARSTKSALAADSEEQADEVDQPEDEPKPEGRSEGRDDQVDDVDQPDQPDQPEDEPESEDEQVDAIPDVSYEKPSAISHDEPAEPSFDDLASAFAASSVSSVEPVRLARAEANQPESEAQSASQQSQIEKPGQYSDPDESDDRSASEPEPKPDAVPKNTENEDPESDSFLEDQPDIEQYAGESASFDVSPDTDDHDDEDLDESSDAQLEAEIEDALSQVSEAFDPAEPLNDEDIELIEVSSSAEFASAPPSPHHALPPGLPAESSFSEAEMVPPGSIDVSGNKPKSLRETDELDAAEISGSPRMSMGAASSAAEDNIPQIRGPGVPAPPVVSSSATMFGIPLSNKETKAKVEVENTASSTVFGLNFSDIQAAINAPSDDSGTNKPETIEPSEEVLTAEPEAAPLPSRYSNQVVEERFNDEFGDLAASSELLDPPSEPSAPIETSEEKAAVVAEAPGPISSPEETTDAEPRPTLDKESLNEESEDFRTQIGVPLSNNVRIVTPRAIGDDSSDAAHTLMGGIAAQAEMMSVPAQDRAPQSALSPNATMQGGLEAPKFDDANRAKIPGALILKPRRKRIRNTQVSPSEDVNSTMRGVVEHVRSGPTDTSEPNRSQADASSSVDEVPMQIGEQKSSNTMMGMQWKTPPVDQHAVDDAWLDYFSSAEDNAIPKANRAPARNESPRIEDGGDDDPRTLPPEALELILESGPIALDLEEAFNLLDSRDKQIAFDAVDDIVAGGLFVLDVLGSMFPGRIFVDRYQHTSDSLPPVDQHGPVLAALVRLGEASAGVALAHLNDSSIESRFYATFLLTRLPAQDALETLVERVFDKDAQTRDIARSIMKTYHLTTGFDRIIERFRAEVAMAQEEKRVEASVDLLAHFRDRGSIEVLIEALGKHVEHTNRNIHHALTVITLQSWSSPYEWKQWWAQAEDEPRKHWIIAALNSPSDSIRDLAMDEIQRIPGLELAYHPTQPTKERERAQRVLEKWYEDRDQDQD